MWYFPSCDNCVVVFLILKKRKTKHGDFMSKVWLYLHKEFNLGRFAKYIKMHKKIVVSFSFHMCITDTI